MPVKFRVELVWEGEDKRVGLVDLSHRRRPRDPAGPRRFPAQERAAMSLPPEADMISVDRNLIRAIKDML